MKSPEQHKPRPKRGKKPFDRKDSPKPNRQHTNRRRQVFTKSGNHSPTQVQQRTPPKQATQASQSMTSQPKVQNGSKTKGGRAASSGKQLQPHSANKPPIKTCRMCTLPVRYPTLRPIIVTCWMTFLIGSNTKNGRLLPRYQLLHTHL